MPDKAFLAAVPDAAGMIEAMRVEKEALEREIIERQAKVDELNAKITALNGLRQAYGHPAA